MAETREQPPARASLPPFEALRVFDAVARLGGVRRAATFLQRDHAVISRHLRALENWLGLRLVERTAMGAVLTDVGRSYHARVGAALDQLASATGDVMANGYHNRLRLWSVPGFALHWLTAHMGEFERQHPQLEIEIRPSTTAPDFAAHEAEAAIGFFARYEPREAEPALVREQVIASSEIVAVASPDYLARHGPLLEPQDLLKCNLLHEQSPAAWHNWLAASGVENMEALAGPRLWQGHLTMDAARHGQGIALTNPLIAREDLASGRLQRVGAGSPAFRNLFGDYLFMARKDRWSDSGMRLFRRWLLRTIAKEVPEFQPSPDS